MQELEDQDVCYEMPFIYGRETAAIKSQNRGCLNKTSITSRVSMPAPSLAEEVPAIVLSPLENLSSPGMSQLIGYPTLTDHPLNI